jgi:D-glycero-D-manno-heptose 1,7-bisphosphate phosphatase
MTELLQNKHKAEALFADRDGIMNRMVRYSYDWDSPQDPEDVVLVDGIEEVISWANKNGIPVIEISNQPGVAKGKMSQETSDAIEAKVHQLLKEKGVYIDKTYICPHSPRAVVASLSIDCDCRKPKPGLLLSAASELDINLSRSVFLGDKDTDVTAGQRAGTKTILYIH